MSISIPSAISAGVGSLPSSWSSDAERAGPVERDADDPALLRQRLQDRLANPPDRVGNELDSLGLVEFMGGADQPEVPLIDQIGKGDALVLVLLGYRDDEPKIAADQLVERLFFTHADALGQANLFVLRNQRVLADFAQVLIQRTLVGGRGAAFRGGTDLQWFHFGRAPSVEPGLGSGGSWLVVSG